MSRSALRNPFQRYDQPVLLKLHRIEAFGQIPRVSMRRLHQQTESISLFRLRRSGLLQCLRQRMHHHRDAGQLLHHAIVQLLTETLPFTLDRPGDFSLEMFAFFRLFEQLQIRRGQLNRSFKNQSVEMCGVVGKLGFGLQQFLLSLHHIVNIGARADPHHNVALRIPHRISTVQMPAVVTVLTIKSIL